MNKDTSWPAFPQQYKNATKEGDGGMTLRDYFAAKAMQALISSRHVDFENGYYEESILAGNAYAMADAMLAERLK